MASVAGLLLAAICFAAVAACRSKAAPPAPREEPTAGATTIEPAAPDDLLDPELVTYADRPGELRGFLFRPAGAGPFPAVVFNHGSERLLVPRRTRRSSMSATLLLFVTQAVDEVGDGEVVLGG
jgi:hypothetical protein